MNPKNNRAGYLKKIEDRPPLTLESDLKALEKYLDWSFTKFPNDGAIALLLLTRELQKTQRAARKKKK